MPLSLLQKPLDWSSDKKEESEMPKKSTISSEPASLETLIFTQK